MANQQHYDLLKQGVGVWNAWREKHRDVHADLSDTILGNVSLHHADLSSVDLSDARLGNTDLFNVSLHHANLSGAKLINASLHFVDLSHADLSNADFMSADLSNANLHHAFLHHASLYGADLSDANLHHASFYGADLSGADLSDANLSSAKLSTANLSNTFLGSACFNNAFLSGTNFRQTRFYRTLFAWVDLSLVKALETASHEGPSSVDINSVILPHNEQTRLHFLRGVGFTENQIEYLPSLLTLRPIEYHSLFISYASQDGAIAQRLHADLRTKDVPCWFAPHDLVPGDYFREEIDKAIHVQDKLLLVLSKDSVASKWVKYEVNRALNREIEQERKILYPIRLDDTVLTSTSGWATDLRAHRHIGDFTGWQDKAIYQEAFSKLLQHLKVTQPPTR
jgi:uncharacterized protein YjbI with pentapeptide repeats